MAWSHGGREKSGAVCQLGPALVPWRWSLYGFLLPTRSGAQNPLEAAPGLGSKEGSEDWLLADFPGWLQKYVCLFDLI